MIEFNTQTGSVRFTCEICGHKILDQLSPPKCDCCGERTRLTGIVCPNCGMEETIGSKKPEA